MNKAFFSIGLSLDGHMVPRGMDLAHADNLTEQPWFRQWSALTQWMFRQQFFRENLGLGEGGDGTGTAPITLTETIASTTVMHLRYTVNG